jgi:GNAT superfamily N-acetyltransferase
VRDDEQGSGLACLLLAETARIALREGRNRLILWGGVQPENRRARRFYAREGFFEVGRTPSTIDMVRPI